MMRHRLLAYTTRVAGLVAALGLTQVAWATSRTVMGTTSIPPMYFRIVGLLLVAAWIVVRLRVRVADRPRSAIWRSFTLTACGAGALLAALSSMAANTIDLMDSSNRVAMIADLMTLVTAEETVRARTGSYARELPAADYDPTSGVSVPAIILTPDGWTASVRHERLPTFTCVVYVGSTPLAPARNPGQPACSGRIPLPLTGVAFGLAMIAAGALLTALAAKRV